MTNSVSTYCRLAGEFQQTDFGGFEVLEQAMARGILFAERGLQ